MAEICRYKVAGLDTEFYGCDVTAESTVGKSVCHVFSVAIPTGPLLPRGFNEATSFVFAGSLLTHPSVRAWLEDPTFKKPVHNQPVDAHTIRNAGVKLRGGINTLEMARFIYPERAKRRGFGLDALGQDLCGVGKTEDFDDLLGYDGVEYRNVELTKKRCGCGELGCRKRSGIHLIKIEEQVWTTQAYKVRKIIPMTELYVGHRLWERYVAYAAWDAVLALWVFQIMLRDGLATRAYPWTIAGF